MKIQAEIYCGLLEKGGQWHFYMGPERSRAYSGAYWDRKSCEKALKAEIDQAVDQFGDRYTVNIDRKDYPES